MSSEEFDDYVHEVTAAYFAEEAEMKLGIHPTQVKERIENALHKMGHPYKEITFLDWDIEGPNVKVSIDGKYFGVFNYEKNDFTSVMLNVITANKKSYDKRSD